MSVRVILQALGWLPVLWLGGVQLLIERGRLPRGGWALRIAGFAAAATVVAAGAATEVWPMAALGLLLLRTEIFGHRAAHRRTGSESEAPGPEPVHHGQAEHRRRMVVETPAPRAVAELRTTSSTGPTKVKKPQGHSSFVAGLIRYGPPALAALFKIEIVIIVIVALVLLAGWSEHQRTGFNRRANTTLCGLMGTC